MSAKLDIITLRGLTAEGIHGVFEFEHAAPQPFVIDLALWVDTTDAITSDDIADTVSYADVANDVVSVVEGPSAHLIETLAQRISDVLLANPRVEGVEVTVHKPKAPLEQEFTDVAITVRRGHTPGTISRIRDITVIDGKVSPEADEPLVSFGGPDEASALPSFSPTGSVSLQGIDIPSRSQVQPQTQPFASVEPAQSALIQDGPSGEATPPVPTEHPFVLALGGNVGDVPVTLAQAVSYLIDIPGVQITDVSPLLRTHAVLAPGQAPQDDHWNAVVIGRTTLDPHDFFACTSSIETTLGRVRHEHWGPRRIDIDIISMGELRIEDAMLTIPHPRAHLRAFVLAPWLLSDPEAVLPGYGPVEDLLAASADIQGIIDAVDDWLESPEGIQAESDTLVAAQNVTSAPTQDTPDNEAHVVVDDSDNEPTRDRPDHSAAVPAEPMRRVADLARPLVIPPIAVPAVAEPLAMSRLDRLDPSSKERLQPDQGADLLWHKVWNSWAQTPIDPEEIADREAASPLLPGESYSVEPSLPDPSPEVAAPEPLMPAAPLQESVLKPAPAVAPTSAVRNSAQSAPLLSFVVAPDKDVEQTVSATASAETPASTADDFPEELSRSRMSRRNAHTASQPAVAQPLPFQQVLVDDVVLEENPGQRQMRWAPVHSYDASSAEGERERRDAGEFASRLIPHPDVPLSTPVADEAEARAELARIEAARAAEAAKAERARQEQEVRELRERERREQEAREAALAQEEAIRLEVARLERERKAAAARAAAEREASLPPLPKRQAQFAPLRTESPRDPSGHEGAERPLPQWDFSSSHVTIVDDSADTGAATGSQSSVLAPDLPEGTPTGAIAEVNGQTGMLSRVTMRPTATGMIPVVKRDSTHP